MNFNLELSSIKSFSSEVCRYIEHVKEDHGTRTDFRISSDTFWAFRGLHDVPIEMLEEWEVLVLGDRYKKWSKKYEQESQSLPSFKEYQKYRDLYRETGNKKYAVQAHEASDTWREEMSAACIPTGMLGGVSTIDYSSYSLNAARASNGFAGSSSGVCKENVVSALIVGNFDKQDLVRYGTDSESHLLDESEVHIKPTVSKIEAVFVCAFSRLNLTRATKQEKELFSLGEYIEVSFSVPVYGENTETKMVLPIYTPEKYFHLFDEVRVVTQRDIENFIGDTFQWYRVY